MLGRWVEGARGSKMGREAKGQCGAVTHSVFRMHVVEWLAKVGSWEGNGIWDMREMGSWAIVR